MDLFLLHRRDMMARSTGCLLFVAVVAALAGVGCIVSPVPQPPNVDPPVLDLTGAGAAECENCDQPALMIAGAPGAVTHPEADAELSLWAADLDRAIPPVTVAVSDDGSFTVSFDGGLGDTIRFQARAVVDGEAVRSQPMDVVVDGDPLTLSAFEPSLECFEVAPSPELELDPSEPDAGGRIEVRNGCAETLQVDELGLLVPSDEFALTFDPIETLASGATAVVEVELRDDAPGVHDAVLIVSVSGPEADRRAVTLIAVAE